MLTKGTRYRRRDSLRKLKVCELKKIFFNNNLTTKQLSLFVDLYLIISPRYAAFRKPKIRLLAGQDVFLMRRAVVQANASRRVFA